MCICTYLTPADRYTQPTSDKELNTLLAEVRAITGEDWRIEERIVFSRRLFRSAVAHKLYSLYNHLHSCEFQVINFYLPNSDFSINTLVDASLIAAYLYGLLAHPSLVVNKNIYPV